MNTSISRRALVAAGLAVGVTSLLVGCASGASDNTAGSSPSVSKNADLAARVPAEYAGKTLVLAGPSDSTPSIYQDENGEWKGWEVDLAKDTAAVLGLNITFQSASFDTIIPGLQSGKFDLAASTITISDTRLQQVDFVQTSVFGQAFAARTDLQGEYDSVESLAGLTVATVKGNTAAQKVQAANQKLSAEGKTTINSVEFPTSADAKQALLSGRADIFFVGELPLQYLVSQNSDKLKIVGRIGESAFGTPLGHGTALQKNSALTQVWAEATQQLIDDGTVDKLTEQYGVGGLGSKLALVNPPESDFNPANPDNKLAALGVQVKG